MSQPAIVDLDHYQGDELDFVLRLRANEELPALYRDLTGKVARSQVRHAPGQPVLVEFECTILDQDDLEEGRGSVRMFATAEDMASVPGGDHVWDLQLTNTDGTGRKTVVAGAFVVTPEVTRD